MSATKPISIGDWVFWDLGLFKVVSIHEEHIPKKHAKGVSPHGRPVATLEPLNVPAYVWRWYLDTVEYHGGVKVKQLHRINPLSAEKRGYLKRPNQ